jgi:hypothetical protein
MGIYRFYFFDESNCIQEAQKRNFADDKDAIVNGPTTHAHRAGYVMEVWQANRLARRWLN